MDDRISRFLAGSTFAVAGASTDRSKYGNKVLRCYLQAGLTVTPVNAKVTHVEGVATTPSVAALPNGIHGLSVVTPPQLALDVVEAARRQGIQHIWFQPGAESDEATARARELGMNCIANGPCILVVLGYAD